MTLFDDALMSRVFDENTEGSHVRRARFHSSVLDSRMLKEKEKEIKNIKEFIEETIIPEINSYYNKIEAIILDSFSFFRNDELLEDFVLNIFYNEKIEN